MRSIGNRRRPQRQLSPSVIRTSVVLEELGFCSTTLALASKAKGIQVVESPSTLPVSLVLLLAICCTYVVVNVSHRAAVCRLLLLNRRFYSNNRESKGKHGEACAGICHCLSVSHTAVSLLLTGVVLFD